MPGSIKRPASSEVGNVSPDHRIYEGIVNPLTSEPFNTPIAYATTEGGVINFTRYLATYWADKGIRVNCISPGGLFADHDPQFIENLTFPHSFGQDGKSR